MVEKVHGLRGSTRLFSFEKTRTDESANLYGRVWDFVRTSWQRWRARGGKSEREGGKSEREGGQERERRKTGTRCANVQSANLRAGAGCRKLEYSIYYNYIYINILHIIILLYSIPFPSVLFRKPFALCTFAHFFAHFFGLLRKRRYLCARKAKKPRVWLSCFKTTSRAD